MPNELEERDTKPSASGRPSGWLTGLVLALAAMGAVGAGFGYQQHRQVVQLTEREQQMNMDISKMRQQMDVLTAALTSVAPPAAEPASSGAPAKRGPAVVAKAPRRPTATDRRLRELQAKVGQQEKQIAETREAIAQTRSELEGQLGSARDELGGSIARTHDELLLLKKSGENEYAEFDLTKSKAFQRVGPINLSLRKADKKRKTYDIVMIVDDNQLTKKKVNLYEPIWIHRSDDPHPMQLVVFRVDKNRVQGYVQAPKYRQSELVATSAPAPPQH